MQSFQGEYQPPYAANGYAAVDLASPLPYVVDGVQATSSGEIKSAELNWRRHAGLVTWLAGFRWVEWNGDLNVRSTSPLGQDLIGVATGNDLYGGQLGADVLLWQGPQGLQRLSQLRSAAHEGPRPPPASALSRPNHHSPSPPAR